MSASARPVADGSDFTRSSPRTISSRVSARARSLTRDQIVRGLERVRSLPSATGRPDVLMGFGRYDRGALKGQFLVIRQWRDGTSVEWTG